jgi:hypothetical protein
MYFKVLLKFMPVDTGKSQKPSDAALGLYPKA